MSGLFSVFNVANRGMATQQKAIGVTSHNIANANTEGYSRQRATMETTRPFNMPSLNNSVGPGQIGTGVQVSAIERVRDSFLDYQVRVETSTHGQYTARDKFLSEIETIFNEPSETGISTLVGKFFDSWHELAGNAQSSNSRTIVVQQSLALTDALNHTATQLDKLKENTRSVIQNTVFEVNDILNQVDQLNQQIIGVKVAGQMPNDLMDRRDLLLDRLSEKFNINIEKKAFEGVDVKPVDLISNNPADNSFLIKSVKDVEERRLSFVSDIKSNGGGSYEISYFALGDSSKPMTKTVSLTPEEYKNINECRVFWSNENGDPVGNATKSFVPFTPQDGELKGYASVQRDIENYMTQLDQIAKAVAFSVNAIHSGQTNDSADNNPFFVNSDASGFEKDITARNITINKKIVDNVMLLNAKYDSTYGDTDGSRALAIAQLRNKNIQIQNIGLTINSRDDMFNSLKGGNSMNEANGKVEFLSASNGMKIDSYFKDTIDKLGVQSGEAKRMVKNQETLLASFQQTRESVSGVSLDEEMASLIQYQHAYQANAKIISTVDELLDVVINGLKR
jgi:flagellar hook-associated protein 1